MPTRRPYEVTLRGLWLPSFAIGGAQRACNVTVLSPELASAYNQFPAG